MRYAIVVLDETRATFVHIEFGEWHEALV